MTRAHVGGEVELLLAFLDQQRDVLVWKLDGLTEEQARRRVPSPDAGLHLLGLVKHLAATEQYWLGELFGRPAEPISLAASDHAELDDGDTIGIVLAYHHRARAAADDTVRSLDLDATATTWLGDTVSLRWAILHVLEEAARHAGHADLVREVVDGRTGHLPDGAPY